MSHVLCNYNIQGQRYKSRYDVSQDSLSTMHSDEMTIVGSYDGHGPQGHLVSKEVSKELPKLVYERLKDLKVKSRQRITSEIEDVFLSYATKKWHKTQWEENLGIFPIYKDSGTTVSLAIDIYDSKDIIFVVTGDAVGIWRKKTEPDGIAITAEAKPTDQEEGKRLRDLGVDVIMGRIRGSINVSRAIGDFGLQRGDKYIAHEREPAIDIKRGFVVSPIPYVTFVPKSEIMNGLYFIGSDGLVELSFYTHKPRYTAANKMYTFISDYLQRNGPLQTQELCSSTFKHMLKWGGTTDDFSFIVLLTPGYVPTKKHREMILSLAHKLNLSYGAVFFCVNRTANTVGVSLTKVLQQLVAQYIG